MSLLAGFRRRLDRRPPLFARRARSSGLEVAVGTQGERTTRSRAPAIGAGLAEEFATVALGLHECPGLTRTVELVLRTATQAVGCTHGAICLLHAGRKLTSAAVTDSSMDAVDRVQLELGEGPLFAALDSLEAVRATIGTDDWPGWSAKATELGVGDALVLPLVAGGRPLGVLSLYGDPLEGLRDEDLAIAGILARHASIAVATARQQEELAEAVAVGKLVGEAIGVLTERYSLSSDRALAILRRYSQDHNTKVREVALELTTTRQVPAELLTRVKAEARRR